MKSKLYYFRQNYTIMKTYYKRYCFIQVTCNMNAIEQTWNENI